MERPTRSQVSCRGAACAEADPEGRRQQGRRKAAPVALAEPSLSAVDEMRERAKEATRHGNDRSIEYVRFADDVVIVTDAYAQRDWRLGAVAKRLRQS